MLDLRKWKKVEKAMYLSDFPIPPYRIIERYMKRKGKDTFILLKTECNGGIRWFAEVRRKVKTEQWRGFNTYVCGSGTATTPEEALEKALLRFATDFDAVKKSIKLEK